MCGIIGYAGARPALPIILEGLKRLEYRGYDSSGVALLEPDGSLLIHKEAGKLSDLIRSLGPSSGTVGIGHTRWATHGKPTMFNAHPHTDCAGEVALVHNGIVENHTELRRRLSAEGHTFKSQTDTEVIPHLIEGFLKTGLSFEEAVRRTANELAGAQAIVAVSKREPDKIVGVRIGHAGGLAVGYADDGMLLSSDLQAMVAYANAVSYLANREMAVITRQAARFFKLDGSALPKPRQPVNQDPATAAKGPYRHFMMKEIMEQPETLISALRDRVDFAENRVRLQGFPFTDSEVKAFNKVVLVGMGTSYHVGLVGRYMIETLARIPSQAENASEFRYRDPLVDSNTLVVSVSQSGETVDTLAGMVEAKEKGARQVTICNVAGSEATRMADYALLMNAGPEIGVASTKTMTGSMVCMYMLAIYLGQVRGTLTHPRVREMLDEVVRLPGLMGRVVDQANSYDALARHYFHATNFLLLGRGINYPMALEGALKMKEISYIHAEGYQAGEMKHGPIALIDENMPVLAIALKDKMYEKMLGNIEEVRAREGKVIALITAGDEVVPPKVNDVIALPPVSNLVSPILTVAPLQLLAYHIAVRRGCDVDQPRNLAKTVTVE